MADQFGTVFVGAGGGGGSRPYTPFDQPFPPEHQAMSQTTFSLQGAESLDTIRSLLESEGVTEALRSGSSLTLSWGVVESSNPSYNRSTGSTDSDGDDLIDEREYVHHPVPRIEIVGKAKLEESSIVTDITTELESRDATLTNIDETLDAMNRRMRNVEAAFDDGDDDIEVKLDEAVARFEAASRAARPRRSLLVTILWSLFVFALGALYGAANQGQVLTLFGSFLKLFSPS